VLPVAYRSQGVDRRMIRQVKWPDRRPAEYVSPFQRGAKERPLRLTLHAETLDGLPDGEARPLCALLDLATLPAVEIAQTTPGRFPHLSIDPASEGQDAYAAAVWRGAQMVRHGYSRVDTKAEFGAAVAELAALENPDRPDIQGVRDDLLMGIAHMAVDHDIVVTASARLLAFRDRRDYLRKHRTLAGINPRLPSEALSLAALFLRSRDEYRPRDNSQEIPTIGVGRLTFYSVLAYEHLPNAWLYESACGRARRPDDTYQLSKSVLVRCMRALEARDALGQLFYVPNYDSITDRVVYHFDYLTLILYGAFDALARVAHRAYEIKKPTERYAGFRGPEFRDQLRKARALDLEQLVSDPRVQDLLFVLGELRNNIHGAAIEAWNAGSLENLNAAEVEVPDNQAANMWGRFTSLGTPLHWGVRQRPPTSSRQTHPYSLRIEPYAFATKALAECLPIINEIMGRTEVTRLLPPGFNMADLRTGPQDHEFFPRKLRHEIRSLG
jgi:hypothetical protein